MLKNRNEVLGHGLGLVTLYLSTTLTLDCVSDVGSGTGTNLKVGEGTGPERKWGAPIRRKAPEKNCFWVVFLHFLALKAPITRFGTLWWQPATR